MEKLNDLYINTRKTRGIESSQDHHRELQAKFKKIYKNQFSKVDPGSIKYLEFRTLHTQSSKDGNYLLKPHKPKVNLIENLQRDHISFKDGLQIISLPKSPWGAHNSYNEQGNFVAHHICLPQDENSEKTHIFDRKQRLFHKISKKISRKSFNKDLSLKSRNIIFKTSSGNMYCPRLKVTDKMYDKVNERFKKIREFSFENSDEVKGLINKMQLKYGKRADTSEVTKRLYTPSPTAQKSNYITEKYRKLWTTEFTENV
ncbi:hypothetical protein SteCoe_8859 [Stentor coeruleus]|uniref:Uncharacterized protein n=1 Tax=Stentor coeruleus TaxID=5963 RepID=A0A1R2CJ33_9CILI|nr:hypothetical protein SteCoe_8859 [Stentor coeruleus]